MNKIIKIQSRGTITIPREIRENLDLKEGDFVEIVLKNKKIAIEPKNIIDKDLQEKVLNYLKK